MSCLRYLTTSYLLVLAAMVCAGAIGCGDDSPTGPGGIGPQPETFPGLKEEVWYFFDLNRNFQFYEIFNYHYEDGRRAGADYYNQRIGVGCTTTYSYDSDGRVESEAWEAEVPGMTWMNTYIYDASGTRITGTEGRGFFNYDIRFTHDEDGYRVGTELSYTDFPGGYTLTHMYSDTGQCILATGEGMGGPEGGDPVRIVVTYTY